MKELDNTQKVFIQMILDHDILNTNYTPFLVAMIKQKWKPLEVCGKYFKKHFPHRKKTNQELLNILRKGWVREWETYLKEKQNAD